MDDKKMDLLKSAHEIFSEHGYKNTNISAITKKANMAVGSFYKYFNSKEEIFLEVYVSENDSVRNKVINKINWDGKPVDVIDELFMYSLKYTSSNKILSEWNNPAISNILHEYYSIEENNENYVFHQFLIETYREKLHEKQFDPELTEKFLKVYDLIYVIDRHITEESFEGYNETLWTLVKYFIKGVFSEK